MRLNHVTGLVEVNEGDHIGLYAVHKNTPGAPDSTRYTKIGAYSCNNKSFHLASSLTEAHRQHNPGVLNFPNPRNMHTISDWDGLTHLPAPVTKAEDPQPVEEAPVIAASGQATLGGEGDPAAKAASATTLNTNGASVGSDGKKPGDPADESDYTARFVAKFTELMKAAGHEDDEALASEAAEHAAIALAEMTPDHTPEEDAAKVVAILTEEGGDDTENKGRAA